MEMKVLKVRKVVKSKQLKSKRIDSINSRIDRKKIIIKTTFVKIRGEKECFNWVLDHCRSFCSYLKHSERNKKDRQAIASLSTYDIENVFKS